MRCTCRGWSSHGRAHSSASVEPLHVAPAEDDVGLLEVAPQLARAEALPSVDLSELHDETEEREERAYRIWMASLGLPLQSTDLHAELRSGQPLLQLEDQLWPGSVDWAQPFASAAHLWCVWRVLRSGLMISDIFPKKLHIWR